VRLSGDPQTAATLEQVYKRSGYAGYLQQRVQLLEHSNPVPHICLAHLYAVLNDQTHAIQYLERAYNERNPWLLNVRVDPEMDSLRSSPRFQDLVRRIGLPQ
jgi:hypothetical protein